MTYNFSTKFYIRGHPMGDRPDLAPKTRLQKRIPHHQMWNSPFWCASFQVFQVLWLLFVCFLGLFCQLGLTLSSLRNHVNDESNTDFFFKWCKLKNQKFLSTPCSLLLHVTFMFSSLLKLTSAMKVSHPFLFFLNFTSNSPTRLIVLQAHYRHLC